MRGKIEGSNNLKQKKLKQLKVKTFHNRENNNNETKIEK